MKKYNNFILSESKIENFFLLIPRPYVNDIYDIVQEFNEENSEIKHGFIYMDLQIIVGTRKKRYASYVISDYKIIRNTKKIFSDVSIQKELQDLKLKLYKQLNNKALEDIINISFNQISLD